MALKVEVRKHMDPYFQKVGDQDPRTPTGSPPREFFPWSSGDNTDV